MCSSFLACPGVKDPATLKALACREGLALSADLQLSRCIVASDCKEVVLALKSDSRSCYSTSLGEIRQGSRSLLNVDFIHEDRASNTYAHNLARGSLDLLQGRRLWLLHSPNINIVPVLLINKESCFPLKLSQDVMPLQFASDTSTVRRNLYTYDKRPSDFCTTLIQR
jgi:hypothetical protein